MFFIEFNWIYSQLEMDELNWKCVYKSRQQIGRQRAVIHGFITLLGGLFMKLIICGVMKLQAKSSLLRYNMQAAGHHAKN